jgi:NAD(P)-dependent dehydrogenase (short-subunit alcohol dehydrogenase family)
MPDGASIVNVTSIEAFRAAPGFSIYSAMKAAVEQLTRTLALELAPRRIRVNCVAPDAIPTPGDHELAQSVGAMSDYAIVVPLGLGTPEDCAAVIAFLAGDLARFVTGSTVHVDGGTDAARGWRRRADGGWSP